MAVANAQWGGAAVGDATHVSFGVVVDAFFAITVSSRFSFVKGLRVPKGAV